MLTSLFLVVTWQKIEMSRIIHLDDYMKNSPSVSTFFVLANIITIIVIANI